MKLTAAGIATAIEYFTQAIALEPTYAQAHAGLAQVQVGRSSFSLAPPRETMPVAKSAALEALALDDTVADAHVALAMVLHFYDWAGAEREYRRAVELSPGDTFARYNYSFLLAEQGRVELSLTEARSAVERDPIEPTCQFMLAFALVFARRFDAAVAEAQSGIEIEPIHGSLHMVLGLGLAGLGRYDEAVGAHRQATKLAPGTDNVQGFLGWALGLAGHPQDAGAILTELKRRGSRKHVESGLLALICVGLGDTDRALSYLQHAAEEREVVMTMLQRLFVYDPLRSDPRFQALLKKMNFPQQA